MMTTNLLTFSESDINRDFARRAYYGTSFSPEVRGDSQIKSYMAEMEAISQEYTKYLTPENETELRDDLEAYRQGYLRGLNAFLSAHSRVASAFIVGPANFPTQSNLKKSDTADRRRNEWLEYCQKTRQRLSRKYNPVIRVDAPISSGDENAIQKLQAKISQAEKAQAGMKQANAVIRRLMPDEEATVAALVKLGIPSTQAHQLLIPDFMGRVGYPDYTLRNNNANIRRMKERVASLEKEQAKREQATDTQEQEVNGVRVVENTELNRLQLIFPGKPSLEVRGLLKSRGFHWSPREGAWQRQLNNNARIVAKEILERIQS